MKYQGKLMALKCYTNNRHALVEFDYTVEEGALLMSSLPFVMLRLDQPHGKIDKEGWHFECGDARYLIPPKELAAALKKYTDEEANQCFQRFYDVFELDEEHYG